MNKKWILLLLFLQLVIGSLFATDAMAANTGANVIPGVNFTVGTSDDPADVSSTLSIIVLITVLSIAPSILILMTSFTRIVIVLGFVRTALATNQMPPTQVLVALALFMTLFVMAPTLGKVNEVALQPFLDGKISQTEALERASVPMKEFMAKQTREKDLMLFMNYSKAEKPKSVEDIPLTALIPAFAISELKTAFQMGFMIFIPFIVIDMIVAAVLMAMGMMMLPPVMISLPFKILLFVLVDGWYLVVQSLLLSF
jgi:flagellar biosynthetic protein FliP